MASEYSRSAREVFDDWARDDHADGMERHHWPAVRQAFESIPKSGGRYLEIGVGNGYGIEHMATHQFAAGDCVGLDISPEMARRTRRRLRSYENVSIECADFLAWSSPREMRFDLIFSMEVFYYFSEIQHGIDRAAKLLAPGGCLMVLVNYYRENIASHGWPGDLDTPMTLWSAEQYRAGFAAAGFRQIEQTMLTARLDETHDAGEPGTLATWGR